MTNKSTEYPRLRINEAVQIIEKFEKELKGYATSRDAFAKLWGYKSANNGAFIRRMSDLRKYSLLEKRGSITITELGKKIAYSKDIQRTKYILEAIRTVPLFNTLIETIGENADNTNWQAQLINSGFSQVDALKEERKVSNIYKTLLPYITNDITPKKEVTESFPRQDGGKVYENSNLRQDTGINTNPNSEVYTANLASDGISLVVPKEKDKIEVVRYLLDRLEKKIDEEKKTPEIVEKIFDLDNANIFEQEAKEIIKLGRKVIVAKNKVNDEAIQKLKELTLVEYDEKYFEAKFK